MNPSTTGYRKNVSVSMLYCWIHLSKTVEYIFERHPPKVKPQYSPTTMAFIFKFSKINGCVHRGFRSHAPHQHFLLEHPFGRLSHTGFKEVVRQRMYSHITCLFRRVNSHFGCFGLGYDARPEPLSVGAKALTYLSNAIRLLLAFQQGYWC